MGSPGPVDVLRDAGRRGALILDYDGTLAPIVDDPTDARPSEGVPELLERLQERFAAVTVVSGRPIRFLATMLPEAIDVVGLYGLEGRESGERWEHPSSGVWREVIDDVATRAEAAGPEGMRVERKDVSITLHYRGHPELADEVRRFARGEADRAGLALRDARMSVELHPPIDADKGTIVRRLVEDSAASVVAFVGDDVGDLSAFAALDELATAGRTTLKVAVASEEAPPHLVEAADLVVDGPRGVVELLSSLAG